MTSSGEPDAPEQAALIELGRPARPRKRPAGGSEAAAADPVARVVVDVPLAHLDRLFEYTVPATLADVAVPGVRVKVPFASRDVDGYLIERVASADHEGRLAPLRRVVGAEPVLTPQVLDACRLLARRCAGTLSDVLRLAVPPRHARAEKALASRPDDAGPPVGPADGRSAPAPGPWLAYPAGESFLRRIAAGEAPAAAWSAAPTTVTEDDWPAALAAAAATALAAGRGALLVVPDHRDVARVEAALVAAVGAGAHVRLTADQGPQARYTAWLKVLRGHVRCVVGTRAAAFAPVADLGLVAWWDDGDDLHAEPRAPYPHVRDILAIRAEQTRAALLTGGFARSAAVQWWVEEGRLREIVPDPARRRALARVHVVGEGADVERDGPGVHGHLPSAAWRAARDALTCGPVLVQVPRRGYVPGLACRDCRAPARCAHCHGPLALPDPDGAPHCRWCGRSPSPFACPTCGSPRLRSTVVGARRTAEELGRAFPGVPVRTSGAGEVLDAVPGTPTLLVATPGAEPVAEGGYAATLLLDAWASLDRPRLDAGEESVRRWLAAAALTRPRAAGGVVILAGAPTHEPLPAVEALVRWAPEWFAAREVADRRELRLPPAAWMARVSGPVAAVREAVAETDLPAGVERLGPLPLPPTGRPGRAGGPGDGTGERGRDDTGEQVQVLLRGPLSVGEAAAEALAAMRRVRSARKEQAAVAVRVGVADTG